MPAPEDMNQESRLMVLTALVEKLTGELKEVTGELRHTNETVQAMHSEAMLSRERLDVIGREIFTVDNASRIRTLEQQIRGLFALVGFLCLTLATRLAPAFFQYLTSGK